MTSTRTAQKELGHEYIHADEESIAKEMADELEAQMLRMYADKKMLRQIHTKMHGCVKAAFVVENNLPEHLRVGVFAEPKTFHAWVRFSNASTVPKHDKKKDVRGVAIKLLNVDGEKLLADAVEKNTQDFLLMSSETFFSKNVKEFRNLLKSATAKNKLKVLLYFLNPLHFGVLKRFGKSNIKCDNPLNISYWSTQPYQFQTMDSAVKYLLKPSAENTIVVENKTDFNYLRYNLAQTLNNNSAEFDFFIQFQTNADTMPVEDPTVAWQSEYIKVATLKIPPQQFSSNEQLAYGENMSFNPWHALTVHRPLGSFNRVRKRIYVTMSKFRHQANHLQEFEPKDSADFLPPFSQNAETIHVSVPTKRVLKEISEILVDCNKQKAFDFISNSNKLPSWLQKSGPIAGAKIAEIIKGPYDHVGAQRKVIFDNGDNIIEELLSFNKYANYSYRISAFSDFLKKLTDAAYSQIWFDTIDDKTRIRWVYSFTYKNLFAALILKLFLIFVYKKWMKQSLTNAKHVIEDRN